MRKLLLFLAFLPNVIFCQTVEVSKSNKLLVGLCFSPDYCYRKLVTNNSSSYAFLKESRDSMEIPKFGFTTGLSFLYKINKRISIELGLQFSNKGEKTKTYTINSQPTDPDVPTEAHIFIVITILIYQ